MPHRGVLWAAHNYPQHIRRLRRTVALFMDAALAALRRSVLEVTDHWPSIVIATLAHEFQHIDPFYQKRVRAPAASETWLNEMASEVAEDLIADKLQVNGPRGVAAHDPTAGAPGNARAAPYYNLFNDLQVTAWNSTIANYALNYALGAYLARTYGGAALFGHIVQSASAGVDALEAALAAGGHDVSFGEVLADWAVATLLSDNTAAPARYRTPRILEQLVRQRRAVRFGLGQPVQLPLRAAGDSVRLRRAGPRQPHRAGGALPALLPTFNARIRSRTRTVRHPRAQHRHRPAVSECRRQETSSRWWSRNDALGHSAGVRPRKASGRNHLCQCARGHNRMIDAP